MKTWVWRKQTNYLMGQHFYLKSQFLQRNEEEEGSEVKKDRMEDVSTKLHLHKSVS